MGRPSAAIYHTTVGDGDAVRLPVQVMMPRPKPAAGAGNRSRADRRADPVTLAEWLSFSPTRSRPDQGMLTNWVSRQRERRR